MDLHTLIVGTVGFAGVYKERLPVSHESWPTTDAIFRQLVGECHGSNHHEASLASTHEPGEYISSLCGGVIIFGAVRVTFMLSCDSCGQFALLRSPQWSLEEGEA